MPVSLRASAERRFLDRIGLSRTPPARCLRTIPSPCRCFPTASWRSIDSEEHTSELQSLMRNSYAVFCLKKKNKREHTNDRLRVPSDRESVGVRKAQHYT